MKVSLFCLAFREKPWYFLFLHFYKQQKNWDRFMWGGVGGGINSIVDLKKEIIS